jgi:hypothetical protein
MTAWVQGENSGNSSEAEAGEASDTKNEKTKENFFSNGCVVISGYPGYMLRGV